MSKRKINEAHYVDVHVGSQLRRKRQELGISQDGLAKSVGLTFQQVQKYEKGLNRISCSKLFEFARFLGTEVVYFFKGLDFGDYNNYSGYSQESLCDGNAQKDIFSETAKLIQDFQGIQSQSIRNNLISLISTLSKEMSSSAIIKKQPEKSYEEL